MNSNQGIEIVIKKNGAPSGISSATPDEQRETREPGKPSAIQKQVNTLLINYGKQTLQEGYKLITDFTGNYVLANKIDAVTNIAADISTIAIGGWVGAVAVGFKYTTNLIESSIQIQRERNAIEARNRMLGEIVQLGGRYTNA